MPRHRTLHEAPVVAHARFCNSIILAWKWSNWRFGRHDRSLHGSCQLHMSRYLEHLPGALRRRRGNRAISNAVLPRTPQRLWSQSSHHFRWFAPCPERILNHGYRKAKRWTALGIRISPAVAQSFFLFHKKRTSAASFSHVSQYSHRRTDARGNPKGRAVALSESGLRKRDPRDYFKPCARRLQPAVFVWRNHEEALYPAGTTSLWVWSGGARQARGVAKLVDWRLPDSSCGVQPRPVA